MNDRTHITLEQLHRDVLAHAGTLTALVEDQRNMRMVLDEMKLDRAVRVERDKNLNERLDRIEASINAVYGLGKWVLGAIGSLVIAAIVTFVMNGGFGAGH